MPFAPPLHIYVLRDGQQIGPYSPEHLKQYVRSGEVDLATQVWYHGCETWVPLGSLVGFQKLETPEIATPSKPASPTKTRPRIWERLLSRTA